MIHFLQNIALDFARYQVINDTFSTEVTTTITNTQPNNFIGWLIVGILVLCFVCPIIGVILETKK